MERQPTISQRPQPITPKERLRLATAIVDLLAALNDNDQDAVLATARTALTGKWGTHVND